MLTFQPQIVALVINFGTKIVLASLRGSTPTFSCHGRGPKVEKNYFFFKDLSTNFKVEKMYKILQILAFFCF